MSALTASADSITTVNPATGEPLQSYMLATASGIDDALRTAHETFLRWRATSLDERAGLLGKLASHFRQNARDYARTITLEMGKTIVEAEAEVEKCAWACEYYAEHAHAHLADDRVETGALLSYAAYRPLGIVLAIMPWNFPFFQVVRFAVPALAAGNVAILKHAANVSGCGLELQRAFLESGFPRGAFSAIVIRPAQVESLIADPRVCAVTLTGSEAAGSSVAAMAGKYLKKSVLELGGSDSFIVLADADIQTAAKTAVRARFQNCGQSCIAAKRFIVESDVYDDFCDAFVTGARAIAVGDPQDRSTTMGPMARADLVDDLRRQVQSSLSMEARLMLGGHRLERPGAFFEPTILADVRPGMTVFDEETFGPAAAVVRVASADEAIDVANASPYGLGNSVWSRDVERAESLAERLQSGLVFVNSMTASDPRLPFGGVKRSGYGRELAHFGIREFTNVQTVSVARSSP